jgi:hypothetical protein
MRLSPNDTHLFNMQAVVAYGLHGGSAVEARTELNYVLLALFFPVAIFGEYFQLEASGRYIRIVAALIVLWALPTLGDNLLVTRQYIVSPPASPHRTLADYLTDRRIKYASASYWDSYRVTFLSQERVIVASSISPDSRLPVARRAESSERGTDRRLPVTRHARGRWCVVDPFQR